jgi:pimeloyl-ACP methyl ester carboxylesterase
LLLHGYPFDHGVWEKVTPRLATDIRVVVPDLPGFGGKPVLPVEPSLDAMADHVANLLAQEQIQRVVVAGFSMGGYVALALADRHPTLLAGLALINSQPFADTDEVRAGRRTMIQRVQREGTKTAAEAALQKLFAPGKASDVSLRGYAERGAEWAGAAGICWALEAMARRPDRTAVLARLEVPLLILHSDQDLFIPVEKIRTLMRNLPKGAYVEVTGGHCTPLENPSAVATALTDFESRTRILHVSRSAAS